MPATKRKRKSSPPYYRRRYGIKPSQKMARMVSSMVHGDPGRGPGTLHYTRYGPSNRQMSMPRDKDEGAPFRTAQQSTNRYMDGFRGDGSYWGDVGKNIGHWGTRIGGAALGGLAALPEAGIPGAFTGAFGGWNKGADISKAMGWGAYDVPRAANQLIPGGYSDGAGSTPIYHSVGAADDSGDVVISNRELVSLITSSETSKAFKIEKFSSNPADETFSHLQQISDQYEQFEFLGLMYQYVPMTGEGGSNELGIIGMSANYDPDQIKSFDNIEQMMQTKGALTFKPSIGSKFGIECDPSKRPVKVQYVRDDVDRPKSFTDLADFFIASQGVTTAGQTLGQLWVTYSVRFRNIKAAVRSLDRQVICAQTNNSAVSTEHSVGYKGREWFNLHQPILTLNDITLTLRKTLGRRKTFKVDMYLKLDSTSSSTSNPNIYPVGNGRIVKTNIKGVANAVNFNEPFKGLTVKGNMISAGKADGEDDCLLSFYISFESGATNTDGVRFNSAAFDEDGVCTFTITEVSYLDPSVTHDLSPTTGRIVNEEHAEPTVLF